MLDGYYDILYNLSSEFDKLIESFKSNVKESSDSTIIDSEVLTQLESKFSPKQTEFAEIETKFETIYSGISDLVAIEKIGRISHLVFLRESMLCIIQFLMLLLRNQKI